MFVTLEQMRDLLREELGLLREDMDNRFDQISQQMARLTERVAVLEIQRQADVARSAYGQPFAPTPQISSHSSASARSSVRIRGIF